MKLVIRVSVDGRTGVVRKAEERDLTAAECLNALTNALKQVGKLPNTSDDEIDDRSDEEWFDNTPS